MLPPVEKSQLGERLHALLSGVLVFSPPISRYNLVLFFIAICMASLFTVSWSFYRIYSNLDLVKGGDLSVNSLPIYISCWL